MCAVNNTNMTKILHNLMAHPVEYPVSTFIAPPDSARRETAAAARGYDIKFHRSE
jgi:hypothetical protein